MLKKQLAYALSALAVAGYTPAFSRPLAQCGASAGQAYYDSEGVWGPDQISKGSYSFIADDKGNPNVLFRDASGRVIDAAADGGRVTFSFIHPDRAEFGMFVVYAEAGVVESYNVITSAAGGRKLYWTSNRSRAAPIAKVAAFVANCR